MTTKARTKGQRRKRGKISLPGGDVAHDRPTGKDRRHTNQPQEDARVVAIAARIRKTGKTKDAALDPICGTDLGLCIDELAKGDDRAQLQDAWAAISAARRNFKSRIIGQTGEPKGAAIAMVPDRMETDPSYRVDIRTAEQRDRGAVIAWESWNARIKALPTPLHIWALRGAMDGFLGEGMLWRDAKPTQKGEIAVAALRMVAKS